VVRFLARLVAVLAASALPALAGTPRFVSITLENDFFAGYDRHYTNGLQAAWLVDRGDLPKILRSAPPVRWSADPEFVVAIGQRIYTPVDIERDIPDPADRPYAGWLYLLADVRTQHGTIVDHVTAGVGIVGPASGARWTQDLAHRVMGQERAHGWGAQLEDEPTVMLGFERTWLGVAAGHLGRRSFDVSPRAGAMLGNALTYANLGLVARYGENLPDDVPAGHISLGPSRDGYRGNATFGWYGWLGVDARAVARNVFLDGSTFRDGPSVDRKPWGYDYQAGVVLAWPQARLAFTVVQRSAEFEGQGSPDRFGQLALSFAY
jgi:hypothetical protein